MLKKIGALFCLFMLSGCYTTNIVPIEVERHTLYCGQTVASLFDNFGLPTSQHVDAWGGREYHYKHQHILRRGLENYMLYCDLVVYTNDGIVENWAFQGNKCNIEGPYSNNNDWFISHEP